MRIVNDIRRRHRAWVDAGRPGVLSEAQLVERITRLEYAVRSFAQWYAAHAKGAERVLTAPEAAVWALDHAPHPHAMAIAEEVFNRGYELGLVAQPNNAAMDIEALLLEMAERDREEVAGRLSTGEWAPPPRLLVVPGGTDSDQPGMHGEGTFP